MARAVDRARGRTSATRWNIRTEGPGAGGTELRLRQRLRMAVPLVKELPWQFIATEELLLSLNRTAFPNQPGFSENRAFAGLGYKLPTTNVELGYMNQFVGGSSTHRVNHVLSV